MTTQTFDMCASEDKLDIKTPQNLWQNSFREPPGPIGLPSEWNNCIPLLALTRSKLPKLQKKETTETGRFTKMQVTMAVVRVISVTQRMMAMSMTG